jgi:head-tail adaptor
MRAPIGEMRTPAAIMTPSVARDASGGELKTYADGSTIFVALRATSGTETAQFGQIAANVSHIAFGHWYDLNEITADHRLKIIESGDEFEVYGPPMNDQKRSFTRLNLVLRENG